MRRALVAVPAAIALGLVAETGWPRGIDPWVVAGDAVTGWVLIGSGLLAWMARRSAGAGRLIVLTGVAWFAGTLIPPAAFLHRGPLIHLVAADPRGRVRGTPLKAVVVAGYGVSAFASVSALDSVGVLIGVVFGALAVRNLRSVPRPILRSAVWSAAAALLLGLGLIVTNGARLLGHDAGVAGLLAYDILVGAIGIAIVLEVALRASATGVLTSVVVDLGGSADAGTLRDRLARAVGDPDLVLGYAVAGDDASWVDDAGSAIATPTVTPDRTVTPISVGGRDLGFVAHDPAFLADPRVMASIASAVGLALSNSATQAEIRRRVAEVDASRARLVHAGDAQGRQLEASLESGALARLAEVEEAVRAAAVIRPGDRGLAELIDAVRSTRARLREFARGVYPGVLRSGGLASGIEDLAERSRVPVRVVLASRRRFDPAIESTLYFVCAEALANVAKHARAASATVELAEQDGAPVVTITDDGAGGAAVDRGLGLHGLLDRVEALGGSMSIVSPPGRGTRLVARVPLGRQPAVSVAFAGAAE